MTLRAYRGRVRDGEVVISDEHSGARWVDPVAMRASMTDEAIGALAAGNDAAASLVQGVRIDLDRYLRRTGRT